MSKYQQYLERVSIKPNPELYNPCKNMDQGHVISLNPIWLPVDGFCLGVSFHGSDDIFWTDLNYLSFKKTFILTLKSTEFSSPYPPTTLKMKRTKEQKIFTRIPMPCSNSEIVCCKFYHQKIYFYKIKSTITDCFY